MSFGGGGHRGWRTGEPEVVERFHGILACGTLGKAMR